MADRNKDDADTPATGVEGNSGSDEGVIGAGTESGMFGDTIQGGDPGEYETTGGTPGTGGGFGGTGTGAGGGTGYGASPDVSGSTTGSDTDTESTGGTSS